MQTNLSKLAELLKITGDEAFSFYSEVRRLSAFEVSVRAVLINTFRYLQENDNSNALPQEVAAFLDEHETELRPKPIQVTQNPVAQPQEQPIVQKRVVPPTRRPLTFSDPDILAKESRRLKREYKKDFEQRETVAFYVLVKAHLEEKGVVGDPHRTVQGLDELTKATLHFYAIKRIYTEADAEKHCGMDYRTEFLQSRYWTIISEYLRLRERDYRDQCPICDEHYPKHTEVHHKSYRNHGLEHKHLEDLVVICHQCHSDISWNDRQQKLLDKKLLDSQ